jgi:hypothetical protein
MTGSAEADGQNKVRSAAVTRTDMIDALHNVGLRPSAPLCLGKDMKVVSGARTDLSIRTVSFR